MLPRLVLVGLLGLSSACAVSPWRTHSAIEANKPKSPLRAAANSALVVVVLNTEQGSGNGGYTVFSDDRGVVAQFDETIRGWSTATLAPGPRRFYLRTWSSDFCIRLDANLAAGKVYMLSLSDDARHGKTDFVSITGRPIDFAADAKLPRGEFVVAAPGARAPAGGLVAFPYVKVDLAKARAELEQRSSQVASCIRRADEGFAKRPHTAHQSGFEEIDFTVPGADGAQ